jgi:hypothetical protein
MSHNPQQESGPAEDQGLTELLDELRGQKVDSTGSFTVDRDSELRIRAESMVEDRRDFLSFLVSSAFAAGARKVAFRVGRRYLEVSFDATPDDESDPNALFKTSLFLANCDSSVKLETDSGLEATAFDWKTQSRTSKATKGEKRTTVVFSSWQTIPTTRQVLEHLRVRCRYCSLEISVNGRSLWAEKLLTKISQKMKRDSSPPPNFDLGIAATSESGTCLDKLRGPMPFGASALTRIEAPDHSVFLGLRLRWKQDSWKQGHRRTRSALVVSGGVTFDFGFEFPTPRTPDLEVDFDLVLTASRLQLDASFQKVVKDDRHRQVSNRLRGIIFEAVGSILRDSELLDSLFTYQRGDWLGTLIALAEAGTADLTANESTLALIRYLCEKEPYLAFIESTEFSLSLALTLGEALIVEQSSEWITREFVRLLLVLPITVVESIPYLSRQEYGKCILTAHEAGLIGEFPVVEVLLSLGLRTSINSLCLAGKLTEEANLAVNKLDKEDLVKIARDGSSPEIRLVAAKQLSDLQTYVELAKERALRAPVLRLIDSMLGEGSVTEEDWGKAIFDILLEMSDGSAARVPMELSEGKRQTLARTARSSVVRFLAAQTLRDSEQLLLSAFKECSHDKERTQLVTTSTLQLAVRDPSSLVRVRAVLNYWRSTCLEELVADQSELVQIAVALVNENIDRLRRALVEWPECLTVAIPRTVDSYWGHSEGPPIAATVVRAIAVAHTEEQLVVWLQELQGDLSSERKLLLIDNLVSSEAITYLLSETDDREVMNRLVERLVQLRSPRREKNSWDEEGFFPVDERNYPDANELWFVAGRLLTGDTLGIEQKRIIFDGVRYIDGYPLFLANKLEDERRLKLWGLLSDLDLQGLELLWKQLSSPEEREEMQAPPGIGPMTMKWYGEEIDDVLHPQDEPIEGPWKKVEEEVVWSLLQSCAEKIDADDRKEALRIIGGRDDWPPSGKWLPNFPTAAKDLRGNMKLRRLVLGKDCPLGEMLFGVLVPYGSPVSGDQQSH